MDEFEHAASILPSHRQILWNCMEFYGFVHFGLYTFAPHREGHSGPEIFNPKKFDPKQWVRAFKKAGMTGLLLTCKHHDGFCLWPSKYTGFSVKSSPWKNGEGDIVKEVSEACKEENLKFGVYLSPWDMHEATYGTKAYNTFFLNQLEELLTNYGDLFCVWFDGACRADKIQAYDWESYYSLIRKLQPEACISICGPDVRWCGNEAGICRDAEWSTVPEIIMETERNPGYWRKIQEIPNSTWKDIGSREFIRKYPKLIWYPAEVDVSIRPSWGYVPGEEEKLHSLKTLMKMYECAVGGNANLLLNVPPNPDGLFDEADINRLSEMGNAIKRMFRNSLTEAAEVISEDTAGEIDPSWVLNEQRKYYWKSKEGVNQPRILIKFPDIRKVNLIVLQEAIETGQHIEHFCIELRNKNQWERVYEGKTVGYKKICRFSEAEADSVSIRILEARSFSTLTRVGIYYDDTADAAEPGAERK